MSAMMRQLDREMLGDAERVYSFEWNPERLRRDSAWKEELAHRQAEIAEALRRSTTTLEACPICGERETDLFAEIHGFPYHSCRSCGHVFLQEAPTSEAMNALYSARTSELKSVHMSIYADPRVAEVRIELIARPKVAFVTKRVDRVGTWVDIGCGTGEILVAAKDQGWRAVGIESDVDEVAFARKRGCEVREAYVTRDNAPLHVGKADIVSLFNVLEHVPRPVDLLQGVAAALSPGSFVVVEVPRHPSLSSLANRAFPQLAHRHMYAPDHLHIFTERSSAVMFEASGLVARAVWTFGQDFSEVAYSLASAAGRTIDVTRELTVQDINVIQAAIDSQGLSDKMIVLCVKTTEVMET